jgi:hypothetical protein
MSTSAALTTTDERLYAIPSGSREVMHAIYITNTTASLRRVRLHHCSQSRASGTDNAIFYDVAIAPNQTLIDSTRFPMYEGDMLRGKADGTGVTVTFHGIRA